MAKEKEKEQEEILTETPEYESESFLEEINTKFDGISGWISCNLYRKNIQGKKLFLKRFDTPPELEEIQGLFGGGEYLIYLKWKDGKNQQRMVTKSFMIEGPSTMPSVEQLNGSPAPPVNGHTETKQNSLTEALDLLIKMKEAGLMGSSAPAQSDSIGVAAIQMASALMTKSMEKPEDPLNKIILEKLTETAFHKASETDLDKAVKTYESISKLANKTISGGGEESTLESVAKIGESVVKLIPVIRGAGLPGGLPGAPVSGPAQLPQGANPLEQILSRIDNNFAALQSGIEGVKGELQGIKADIKELQDEVFEPEPVNPSEQTDDNVIQLPASNGTAETQTEGNTEMDAKKQAASLKALPMDGKVKQLNAFLRTYTIDVVYNWCIQWGAVDSLEEFNEIMKSAGREAFVPKV